MAASTNGISTLEKCGLKWRPTVVTSEPRKEFAFDDMDDALAAFKAGEFLVVMDDESRENEGDLIIAASACTTEKMAWMIKHTRYVHDSSMAVIMNILPVGTYASDCLLSVLLDFSFL